MVIFQKITQKVVLKDLFQMISKKKLYLIIIIYFYIKAKIYLMLDKNISIEEIKK